MGKRGVLILLVGLVIAILIRVALTTGPAEVPPPRPDSEDTPPTVVDAPKAVDEVVVERRYREAPGAMSFGRSDRPAREPGSRDPEAWDKPPEGFFGILTGWVVDVSTGEPIVGARIAYGPPTGTWGERTDAKGWFKFGISSGGRRRGPWRLRVTATGYEAWEAVPDQAELRVELIPTRHGVSPGRIRGRVLDRDGIPLCGAVRIVLTDPSRMNHWLTVLADETGEFVLEAIEPGGSSIGHERGSRVNVFLPSGGEVPVTIRSHRSLQKLERGSSGAEYTRKLERALAEMRAALPATRPELREVLQRDIRRVERQLEISRAASRRREVTVRHIPAPNDTRLVCESTRGSPTERWWAVVSSGTARFPALYPANWVLKLKLRSGEVVADTVVGETGDVTFNPRKVRPTTEPR